MDFQETTYGEMIDWEPNVTGDAEGANGQLRLVKLPDGTLQYLKFTGEVPKKASKFRCTITHGDGLYVGTFQYVPKWPTNAFEEYVQGRTETILPINLRGRGDGFGHLISSFGPVSGGSHIDWEPISSSAPPRENIKFGDAFDHRGSQQAVWGQIIEKTGMERSMDSLRHAVKIRLVDGEVIDDTIWTGYDGRGARVGTILLSAPPAKEASIEPTPTQGVTARQGILGRLFGVQKSDARL